MQEVSKDIFYKAIENFDWVPYTQTLAYNLSIVPENTLHWYLDDEKKPQIGCVGFERHKLGLSMLCIKGECLQKEGSIDRKKYAEFYRALHETGFDIYEINLDTHYSEEAEIALRTAGWLRPIGMFSTTLSKIISTTTPLVYDKSWKRNLKKANEASLKFEIKEHIIPRDIQEYVKHHKDLLRRKGFNEGLTENGLSALSYDPHFKMCFITNPNGVVGGGIFYEQKNASITLYSFSTSEGREFGAAYLFYDGIIAHLNARGITTLDVGRISPATHKKNNIFLFKDGIGGKYVNYLGEWEYCKKEWMSIVLYFMKRFIWKRVRV